MKDSNKNWEEQMKQILDEQEIVFEETDWKAAQALIQAANLHIPTENKKRRGLGWFWTVLVGGILLGYMVGSGHFSTPKLAAKNDAFSQAKTIQKGENVRKTEVGALALTKESDPSAKAEAPIEKFNPAKISPIQTTKTEKSVNIIPFTETNQAAISAENITKDAEKQAIFMAETGTILDNKQVKSICPRNINSVQKIALPQSNLSIKKDNTIIINELKTQKHQIFFSKISANAYAGAAYSLQPHLNSTFYGGIKMAYQINPHFSLTFSGNYAERKVNFTNSLNNANLLNLATVSSDPDFTNIFVTDSASIAANTIITTTEAIYLRAARYLGGGVGISFQQKRHQFFANLNYYYLLNTQSKYTVNITENQSLIYQDSKNISDFVAGINRSDISLGLGYEYALTRKIGLQIAVNKGFKDMSNDSFYQNQVKHRNFQVQTGIVYRLF